MKTTYLRNGIGGAFLALSLLLGIVLSSATTTQAQWQNDRNDQYRREREDRSGQDRRDDRNDRRHRGRNGDGYPNYGGSYELRQTALNAGYNNGIKQGRKDRQRGERFDYRDESDYQKATRDYNSRMGDRELYRQYFREAFARGYEDGYNGY